MPSAFETDRNDDSRITADELGQRFELSFTQFDKDRNGTIERSELLSVRTSGGR